MSGEGEGAVELQRVLMESPRSDTTGLLQTTAVRSTDPDGDAAASSSGASGGSHGRRELGNGEAGGWHGEEGGHFDESGSPKQADEDSAFLKAQPRSASLGFTSSTDANRGPGMRSKPLEELTPARRYYTIVIFTLTAAMLYADQNLMAPLLGPIAREFGFDAEEQDKYLVGNLGALFFAVGAPSAVLIGYLCDRMNRRILLFAVVVLGEGPCLATYFVDRYWQLLMLRVMTGVSMGGTIPLVYSLVGDLFELRQRAAVAAGIQVATGVGLAAGQSISGFVGPHTGWRWPFVIVAIPALILAVLMLLTTKDTPRGATESALQEQYANVEGFEYKERLNWQKVKDTLTTPSNLCVILQGLPGSLPWGVLLTLFTDFLIHDQGFDTGVASIVVSVWGFGGGVGVLGGGVVGQLLYDRRPALMPVFVGASVCFAPFPIWFLINADLRRVALPITFLAAFVGGVLSSPPGPNARAVLLNVNEPEARGFALGLMTVLDDLGKGAGPFVVSRLIIHLHGRVPAFNISIGAWIPCGLVFACAAFTLTRDENRMQEKIRKKIPHQPIPAEDALEEFSIESSPRLRTFP